MKKPKVIVGLCLFAQAVLFMILFVVYWNRSKSLSRTLGVLSAVSGLGGAWLLLTERQAQIRSDAIDDDFYGSEEDFDGEEETFDGEIDCSFGDVE
ncbi:MAG: hypothetical protein J1E00_05705 [Oscillospiraceae bacterium]|nr:hypothetical protein [Oscillospiraceae bacterium]